MAYTDGMAELELVPTQWKAGHAVAWKCSGCDKKFDLYVGLPAAEEKSRVLNEQFAEHLKQMHDGK